MWYDRLVASTVFLVVAAKGTIMSQDQCAFQYLRAAPLANLAIAGAHKAAAIATAVDWVDCVGVNQQLDIATQAESGIRFFDLDLELTGARECRAWHGESKTRFDLGMEFPRSTLHEILDDLNPTIQRCSTSDFFIIQLGAVRCAKELLLSPMACRQEITELVVAAAGKLWGTLRVFTEYVDMMRPPRTVNDARGSVFILDAFTLQQTWCADCQTAEKQLDACKSTDPNKMTRLDLYTPSACGWRTFRQNATRDKLFRLCDYGRRDVKAQYPTVYLVDVVGPPPAPHTEVYPVTALEVINLEKMDGNGAALVPSGELPVLGQEEQIERPLHRSFEQLPVPRNAQHAPSKPHRESAFLLSGESAYWLSLLGVAILSSVALYVAFGCNRPYWTGAPRSGSRQFVCHDATPAHLAALAREWEGDPDALE